MKTDNLIVYCTVPNEETALTLSRTIVSENLAACCNIIPGLRSIYSWNGEICDDNELLLMMKTHADVYARLEERIRALHPYDVPEILAVAINYGLTDYLKWVNDYVK